jgi:hypothetical protein
MQVLVRYLLGNGGYSQQNGDDLVGALDYGRDNHAARDAQDAALFSLDSDAPGIALSLVVSVPVNNRTRSAVAFQAADSRRA